MRLTDRWSVPVGSLLLSACGVIALAGFPLDDIWHRLFGQDVTAWGPTHIQLIGGASLSTLACWALVVEGQRVAGDGLTPAGRFLTRVYDIGFAGALLIGMSTLQVEFDFGVPQFRGVLHPVLIALGTGVALVAVRIRLGTGGALAAVAFFWVARGALTLGIVGFERSTQHIPLYVVEALVVELVAWPRGPRSPDHPRGRRRRPHRHRRASRPSGCGAARGCRCRGPATCCPRRWSSRWWPGPRAGCSAASSAGRSPRRASVTSRRHAGRAGLAWIGAAGVLALGLPITESTAWRPTCG